jgi:hypothetical protein
MSDSYLFAFVLGAFLVGGFFEHLRRSLWFKRKPKPKQNVSKFYPPPQVAPISNYGEQLRVVMEADFEKRPLMSKSEARLFYEAENTIKTSRLNWRVMAQVSLGEILTSPDPRAYAAINSKRVDMLIITSRGVPIAVVEYQGEGHYQGSAAARDAVKKEALRKAGIRYIEMTHEHSPSDLANEMLRIAKIDQEKVVSLADARNPAR